MGYGLQVVAAIAAGVNEWTGDAGLVAATPVAAQSW
jgi:hypothetical protein